MSHQSVNVNMALQPKCYLQCNKCILQCNKCILFEKKPMVVFYVCPTVSGLRIMFKFWRANSSPSTNALIFFLTDFIFFPRKSAHTVELFFVFKGETVKRDILKPKLKSPEVPIRISVPLI